MSKFKNYDNSDEKKNLKNADREKITESGIQNSAFDVFGSKEKDNYYDYRTKKNKARRRLPIAVDIIIAILLLAIVAAVIMGGYFALRYFTIDYDSVNIEYSILVESDNVKQYADLAGKHIYMDVDGNTLYMGKISEVDIYENDGAVVVTVEFEAKYKSEEGYFAEDYKIAVSKKLDVRTDSMKISGKIVELQKRGDVRKSTGTVTVGNNLRIFHREVIG